MAKNVLPIIICLVFAFIAGFALLHPGLPPTHDGESHVIRFYEFDKTLRDGNVYPRWAPDLNNGYGVPLFNYVYPLPNYIASFFHFFGFSFIDALKLNLFFATMFGAVFFYAWSKEYWGNLGGIVSSVFYTFSPYRFVDIYVRGSVGEVWALAFFPAFLWSFDQVVKREKNIYIPLSAVFLSLIIFSHNILAVMFFCFVIFYALYYLLQQKNKKSSVIPVFTIVFIGLGMSAIFWLPALLEQKYATGLQIFDIRQNFPEVYELLIPSWGSGFSRESLGNKMSYQIGVSNLIATFISFIGWIVLLKRKDKKTANLLLFFLVSFAVICFLMLKQSLSIWEKVSIMQYFQFPWRFLSLIILITSFLAGSIYKFWTNKILFFIMIGSTVLLTIGYTKPAYYHRRQDAYYLTRSNFIDGTNSPGNFFNTIWFDKTLKKQTAKLKLTDAKDGRIAQNTVQSQYHSFTVETASATSASLQTAYFPGWKVFLDGKPTVITEKNGIIIFHLQKGRHIVEAKFTDTIVRRVAMMISLLSFAVLLYITYRSLNLSKQR